MNRSVKLDEYPILCSQILVLCQLRESADQSSFHVSNVTSHLPNPERNDIDCQVRPKPGPNLLLLIIGTNLHPSLQLM